MAYVVNCECGVVVRGETMDELVDRTTEHIRVDHPEMLENLKREDIEGWAQLAP
jgi:predicted small metal-binding protein